MKQTAAEIIREYGPFPGVDSVHGVSFDGRRVWMATGTKLNAFDPDSGEMLNSLNVAADAGTAFDGEHLFQIAEAVIRKIDPKTGEVLATIPVPGDRDNSGLAWAEGSLWSDSIAAARSIKWTPRREMFCARLKPIASSQASPGSMASSGMAPGRTTKATSAALILRAVKCWSNW